MNRALWIAATGMESQQLLTDTIANNMANVNTTAYKRSVAHFQDLLYQTIATPGTPTADSETSVGIQMGNGVRTVSVSKNFTQAALKSSSSSLDIAIEGNGLFQVDLADGTSAYSRAGNFHLNSTGQIVTAEGYTVAGFPAVGTNATAIDIASDGTVSTTVDGTVSNVGRISLAKFPNEEGLSSIGQNLYIETESSGTALTGNPSTSGFGNVAQYYLESSNVEIVKEMVDLIASQRAYELNSKSIKTADEMLRMVTNLR